MTEAMFDTEKIVEQIRKLLALAGNNPSQNEANSAALKAQALMAKYNIDIADVEDEAAKLEEIVEEEVIYADGHTMTNWKLRLASVICANFRVKHWLSGDCVVFYGHKTDVKIAKEMFSFLAKTGNKLAVKEYNAARKEGRRTSGLMNTFLLGYVQGLSDVLEKQCVALMIVTPEDVKEAYAERTKGFGTCNKGCRGNGNMAVYGRGRDAGRSVANSRAIEG